MTSLAIGLNPEKTTFGIDPEILAALTNIEKFQEIDWTEFALRMKELPVEDKSIYFPDGTSIVEH